MKKVFTLILCLFITGNIVAGENPYEKLPEINPYWSSHSEYLESIKDVNWLEGKRPDIKTHLALVEQALRISVPSSLDESQMQNRLLCLDILNAYWNEESFPVNEFTNYRWPVFIDNYDNFCAVGYLLKETGYEKLARAISEQNNLVLVKEIEDERVVAWAQEYGFTTDELAWIQPGYLPTNVFNSLGSGTNGTVNDLAIDSATNILYAGGSFSMVDGTTAANNIAMWYPGFAGYTWLDMGSGVNGPVFAVAVKNGEVYAGGSFTMAGGQSVSAVARWDGSQWNAVGSNLVGYVNELYFYQGSLYAGGSFTNSGPVTLFNNLAKFDGAQWVSAGGSPDGPVNVMEASNGMLIVGGDFGFVGSSSGNTTTPNIASYNGSVFSDMGAGIPATVTTLENFNGKLFAGGYFVEGTDTFGIASYDFVAGLWTNRLTAFGPSVNFERMYFCDFHAHSNIRMIVGGNFLFTPLIGFVGKNLVSMDPNYYFLGEALMDSTINKLTYMNAEWFMGGYFTTIDGAPYNYISSSPLNGVGSGIPPVREGANVTVYPNPTTGNLFYEDSDPADQLVSISIYNNLGELIKSVQLSNFSNEVQVDDLKAGAYHTLFQRWSGATEMSRVVLMK